MSPIAVCILNISLSTNSQDLVLGALPGPRLLGTGVGVSKREASTLHFDKYHLLTSWKL